MLEKEAQNNMFDAFANLLHSFFFDPFVFLSVHPLSIVSSHSLPADNFLFFIRIKL